MESLTSLLREDATWSMPPYEMWLQTHDDIRAWCLGPRDRLPGFETPRDRGERHAGVRASSSRAAGGAEPWSLQVLEVSDGRIAGSTSSSTRSACSRSSGSPTSRRLTRLPRRRGQNPEQTRQRQRVLGLLAGAPELDRAPDAPGGQLEPSERVDRDRVRVGERAHVAHDRPGVTTLEQPPRVRISRGWRRRDRADRGKDGSSRAGAPPPRDRLDLRRRPGIGRGRPLVRSHFP